MTEYGRKTSRGWELKDLYDLQVVSHSEAQLSQIRDDYLGAFKPEAQQVNSAGAKTGIVIKLAATHAGLITRNNGFYLPDKMRSAVGTWTDHYPKPIQIHHNDSPGDSHDPIGRVIAARYVDTSNLVLDNFKNSVLRDSSGRHTGTADKKFWDSFISDKTSFISKLNQIRLMDSILQDPHYQGVGYIELTANITDSEAIQKVLDGRYITGSVGAVSDKAVCSVCNMDWLEEAELCGHRPGRMYDGKKCMVITGNLEYDEYSFVNTPADRHSRVLGIENTGTIQDSADKAIRFLPVWDKLKEEDSMEDNATTTDTVTEKVTTDTVEASTTQQVETTTQVTDTATVTPEPTRDELVTSLLDKLLQEGKLSDEEQETLYQYQVEEMDQGIVQDAKLSTAARKKLASSTFCGPQKSFPVPDCAHVTAARRLIGRYKGPGDKSAILACVARKAKAMGCDSSEDSAKKVQDNTEITAQVQEVVTPPAEHEFSLASKYTGELTDQVKSDLAKIILDQAISQLGKETLQAALVSTGLLENPEEIKVLTDEVVSKEELIGDLRDQLAALRRELKAAYEDVTLVEDQLIKSREEIRSAKTDKLSLLHQLDGSLSDEVKSGMLQLSDSALDNSVNTLLAKVDIQKISDRLNSGLSRIPDEKVEVPAGMTEPAENNPKPTFAQQQMVDEVYRRILLSHGHQAATAFYKEQVKLGHAVHKD